MGTVAGDDTLLCVADEGIGGRALAEHLRDLAGLS
jgi:arginine repressor